MYTNLKSALSLVKRGPQIAELILLNIFEDLPDSDSDNSDDFQCNIDNYVLQLFNQSNHFYLVRDSELSKGSAKILGSRVTEIIVRFRNTHYVLYITREQ